MLYLYLHTPPTKPMSRFNHYINGSAPEGGLVAHVRKAESRTNRNIPLAHERLKDDGRCFLMKDTMSDSACFVCLVLSHEKDDDSAS